MSWSAHTPETVHSEIDLDEDLVVSPPLEQLHPDARGQLEDVLETVNGLIATGAVKKTGRGFRVSLTGHVNTAEFVQAHGDTVAEVVSLHITQGPLETSR